MLGLLLCPPPHRSHLGAGGLGGTSSKMTGGSTAKSLGGPPVEGLYDHPVASPARTSTPFMTGMGIDCVSFYS